VSERFLTPLSEQYIQSLIRWWSSHLLRFNNANWCWKRIVRRPCNNYTARTSLLLLYTPSFQGRHIYTNTYNQHTHAHNIWRHRIQERRRTNCVISGIYPKRFFSKRAIEHEKRREMDPQKRRLIKSMKVLRFWVQIYIHRFLEGRERGKSRIKFCRIWRRWNDFSSPAPLFLSATSATSTRAYRNITIGSV